MTTLPHTASSVPRIVRYYIVLIVMYSILIWLIPPSQAALQMYNLDATSYRIVISALALPTFIAWLPVFVGYARLRDYSLSLQGTPDGPSFRALAKACLWFACAFTVPPIATLILGGISHVHPDFKPTSIILINYLRVILGLVAFLYIGLAARYVTAQTNRPLNQKQTRIITAAFSIFGLVYCYLTLSNFDDLSFSSNDNPYYLPLWIMLLTIIVPNLYAWFTGLLAAYQLQRSSRRAKGILYRSALNQLVGGLLLVIASAIALQYVNSVSPRIDYFVIDYRVIELPMFRLLAGAGFVLITLGATKLKRFEEI